MKVVKITELQKQLGIIGVVTICLFIAGIWLVILPAFKKGAQLNLENSQIGRKQELLNQIEADKLRIKELEVGLLSEKERHLILSHVTTLAKRAGLDVDVVNPDFPQSNIKTYPLFLVRLRAVGTFQKTLRFLGGFDLKNPKLGIYSMELSQNPRDNDLGEKKGIIAISIVGQTLLLNSQEPDISLGGRR